MFISEIRAFFKIGKREQSAIRQDMRRAAQATGNIGRIKITNIGNTLITAMLKLFLPRPALENTVVECEVIEATHE